jgi:hypothetical protein
MIEVLCGVCGEGVPASNIITHHAHCKNKNASAVQKYESVEHYETPNNYIVVDDGNSVDYLFNDNVSSPQTPVAHSLRDTECQYYEDDNASCGSEDEAYCNYSGGSINYDSDDREDPYMYL